MLGIFVLHYRFQQCERTVVCKVYIYYFIWGVNSSCSIKQCGLHLKTVRESAGDLGRKRGKRESWRVTLNFLRPKHPMRMTAKRSDIWVTTQPPIWGHSSASWNLCFILIVFNNRCFPFSEFWIRLRTKTCRYKNTTRRRSTPIFELLTMLTGVFTSVN